MRELVETRVVEICPGEWVVQFIDRFGWSNIGDGFFASEAEAQSYLNEQIRTADLDA